MDAIEQAQTDFLYLRADWTMQRVRERLQWLPDSPVVIERIVPWREEPFFYLFTARQILDRFDFHVPPFVETDTLEKVMDLHEPMGVDMVESNAAPGQSEVYVVVEEGCVVGYHVPNSWGWDTGGHYGGGTSFGVGAEPGPRRGAEVPRKLAAEFPDEVELGKTATLSIYITSEVTTVQGVDLTGRQVGTEVTFLIQPRRGFAIDGPREGALTITGQKRTTALTFTLRATSEGQGDIRVLVFISGAPLGSLTLSPRVVNRAPAGAPAPKPRSVELAPPPAQLPDLTLFVEDLGVYGIKGYALRLTATDPALNLYNVKYGPVQLRIPGDPGAYFHSLFEEIQNLKISTPNDRQIAEAQIRAKGARLSQELLPDDVQQVLWDLKDRIASMIILTEEPWIPWELCRLVNPKDLTDDSGKFFCEQFSVTRWMTGPSPKRRLTMGNIAVVRPADSGLPKSRDEVAYIRTLAGAKRQVTEVPARFMLLRQQMATGQYDVWHFTGHGSARDESNPNRLEMILENQEVLTPEDISGGPAKMGQAQPIVFLNACQIGRAGMSLTEIGGWARRFLSVGAGAFIGAYWSIYDQQAYEFTMELYGRLDQGLPIGQAVKEARCEIQRRYPGNPTWLAYTVYADPFAQVQA